MKRFAGGVRDEQEKRAFVPVADEVVAVDLETGTVLWRRADVGRPIAATGDRLVTYACDAGRCALRVVRATDGVVLFSPIELDWPAWVEADDVPPEAFSVTAADAPRLLRLAWDVRRRRRGGPPPRVTVRPEAAEVTRGFLDLDLDAGVARRHDEAADAWQAVESAPLVPESVPSDDPGVIAVARVGRRQYTLRAAPAAGEEAVWLEATDLDGGPTAWRTKLTTAKRTPPPPLPR